MGNGGGSGRDRADQPTERDLAPKARDAAGSERGGAAPQAVGLQSQLLTLQRLVGNQAVVGMLASRARPAPEATSRARSVPAERVQREWDADAYETSAPEQYRALLTAMAGFTPTLGKGRLGRLAARTDSAAQLDFLLHLGIDNVERYLGIQAGAGTFPAATIETLMRKKTPQVTPQMFIGLLDNLLKFKIDVATTLATTPTTTLNDLNSLVNAAKVPEGLISQKGTEIVWTTVAAVSGDGIKGEKAAVKTAVEALDKATLVGTAHGNNQGNLPGVKGAGGYTEYDVAPPPGTADRGKRRLVVHNTSGRVYYTWNHYGGSGGTILPCYKRIR